MSNRHARFELYLLNHRQSVSGERPATESHSELEKTFNSRVIDAHSGAGAYIQDLINVARGTAMILDSMWESMADSRQQSTISGLANALRDVVEPADAYFFESVGELNTRIPPRFLVPLLEKELEKARQAAAKEEQSRSSPF